MATQKTIHVTDSKQCIHLRRSDRCPPTSNMLQNINSLLPSQSFFSNLLYVQGAKFKAGFDYTRCFASRMQHILLSWHIVWFSNPFHLVEETIPFMGQLLVMYKRLPMRTYTAQILTTVPNPSSRICYHLVQVLGIWQDLSIRYRQQLPNLGSCIPESIGTP